MSSYTLKIELLSDLCVSDGGVYNSALDTDICYDEYGFPYIPAKRIRGCLRECALELSDIGFAMPVGDLFGGKGGQERRTKIRIGDAHLEGQEEKIKEVKLHEGNLIFHPQNILNHYSYVRTQTSIDYETGVADPTSLRTMRVANRKLVFLADVEMDEDCYESLKACCDIFAHMGIGRTRGLGEIRAELSKKEKDARNSSRSDAFGSQREDEETANVYREHAELVPNAVRIEYILELEEPVICKSTNGGEASSQDYIEGSKILGLIVQEAKRRGGDASALLSEGNLFCSNAYIAAPDDGKIYRRYVEVPANYYSIKNDSENWVEKQKPEDSLKDKQLNMMKHCYVQMDDDKKLARKSVKIEERYHHRRPQDKSIGRASDDGSGDSEFYQMSSIEAGQTFAGYITGTANQIARIYAYLSSCHIVYLGYSRSSEYGKVNFTITQTSQERSAKTVEVKDFIVKLEAPALIYNDRAFYSTDFRDLDAEIRCALAIEEEDVVSVDHYVNYTTLGGYNVTWNRRKPTVEAFDKGTVLHYHLEKAVEIVLQEPLLLGERTREGLGEASVCIQNEKQVEVLIRKYAKQEEAADTRVVKADAKKGSFAREMCKDMLKYYVRMKATGDVKDLDPGDKLKKEAARPTVSNMLLMCRECHSAAKIQESVEKRYGKKSEKKEEKLGYANTILERAQKGSSGLLENFSGEYSVTGLTEEDDEIFMVYLESYLKQLKYEYRGKRENVGKEEA